MNIRRSINIQGSVILALFIRELRTRFGKYFIGYFWPILEPIAHVLILSMIFSFRGSSHSSGLEFVLIFSSGIISYFMFSNISNRSMNSVESNYGLFSYRQVKPMDTIYSRVILELLIYSTVLFLFMSGLNYMGYDINIHSMLKFYLSWMILLIFSFSLGLIFMTVVGLYPESKKILSMVTKPLYFISGVFFTASEVPQEYRELLLLNPIFNVIESIREALFSEITTRYSDIYYSAYVALALLFVSLFLYNKNKIKLLTS